MQTHTSRHLCAVRTRRLRLPQHARPLRHALLAAGAALATAQPPAPPQNTGWYWGNRGGWNSGGWSGNGWNANAWRQDTPDTTTKKWQNGPAKDDDPPSWDGKSPPLQTYLRQIKIWEHGTKMEPERRGVKLLGQLKGDAFEKMHMVRHPAVPQPLSSLLQYLFQLLLCQLAL